MADDPVIVVLAAGRGTRMRGADKLLEPAHDMPLIRLMAGRAAKAGRTRVVLAEGQAERRAALDGVKADVIELPPGGGMAASIVAGVTGVSGPVLLMLADMPGITAADLHLLIALSRQAPGAILRAAGADGQPGHPVLFPADLVPHLRRLAGDRGARDILRAHAGRVHLVPLADDRALVDLDTPEDWADWRARPR